MSAYGGMVLADGRNVEVICDLRSDTVTQPDAAMRAAMAAAEVGDDVYGDDPSVNRLEAVMAERLGKEAGLFVTSGTQSNLLALLAHCARGEEAIVGRDYHIYADEAAGASVLGGLSLCPVPTGSLGEVSAQAVAGAVKEDDSHYAVSRLLCLENTVHGRALSLDAIRAPVDAARAAGLSTHLDGARFFNAITALGCDATDLASLTDTVSACMSKGLGAPVGSVLVGPKDLLAKARRTRKMLGGGMRQAGVLAAGALHALEHHTPKLAEDHARAEQFAASLTALDVGEVDQRTNMVFFTPSSPDIAGLVAHLAGQGVRIGGQAPTIRLVVHRDAPEDALRAALSGIRTYYEAPASA